MLTVSTFSLLHEKNNFASQFFVIISYYRFTYEIHKRLYVHPRAMHIIYTAWIFSTIGFTQSVSESVRYVQRLCVVKDKHLTKKSNKWNPPCRDWTGDLGMSKQTFSLQSCALQTELTKVDVTKCAQNILWKILSLPHKVFLYYQHTHYLSKYYYISNIKNDLLWIWKLIKWWEK